MVEKDEMINELDTGNDGGGGERVSDIIGELEESGTEAEGEPSRKTVRSSRRRIFKVE